MSIKIIAAISNTNQLGYKNELLCHLPNDLKRFKELTTGDFVIMGKNTFNSIGRSLPNRQNIVLTTSVNHNLPVDVYAYHSVEDVLFEYENYSEKQETLWIIGGGKVYSQFLPFADYIYLTIIDTEFQYADTYFPEFNLDDWKVIDHVINKADDKHEFDYHYVTYRRK